MATFEQLAALALGLLNPSRAMQDRTVTKLREQALASLSDAARSIHLQMIATAPDAEAYALALSPSDPMRRAILEYRRAHGLGAARADRPPVVVHVDPTPIEPEHVEVVNLGEIPPRRR